MIVIDAALIFEISIERNFDFIVVVNSTISQRQKRVFQRDKISRKDFNDRVDKQIDLADKVKWADYVINNNSTIDDLKVAAQDTYNKLMTIQKSHDKQAKPKRRRNKRSAPKPN